MITIIDIYLNKVLKLNFDRLGCVKHLKLMKDQFYL